MHSFLLLNHASLVLSRIGWLGRVVAYIGSSSGLIPSVLQMAGVSVLRASKNVGFNWTGYGSRLAQAVFVGCYFDWGSVKGFIESHGFAMLVKQPRCFFFQVS